MALIRVILRQDVINLGEAGDLVSVKPGYARNFLLPKGQAELATESKVKQLEHQRRVVAEKMAKDLKDLRGVADRVRGTILEVTANAGEDGKLFGSVTTAQIAQMLAEKGFKVDRRKIGLSEPIRQVGEHVVEVKLHREVTVEVKVQVLSAGVPVVEEETLETGDLKPSDAEEESEEDSSPETSGAPETEDAEEEKGE